MKMLKRCDHGAATFSVSLECSEVMIFGGQNDFLLESKLADTVVLRFGRFISYILICLCNMFLCSFINKW